MHCSMYRDDVGVGVPREDLLHIKGSPRAPVEQARSAPRECGHGEHACEHACGRGRGGQGAAPFHVVSRRSRDPASVLEGYHGAI